MARILVIDDEQYIRTALREVLEREGFEVRAAGDGKKGLELLETEGADLVITDVIMPGMDGVATLEQIKQNHPDIPVIVISGGGNIAPLEYEPGAISTSAYLASAAKAGASCTLTKPFNRQELVSAVSDLLSA
ncbi:MAG: response regulator [Woeseiaceae bacterium]|jgi:CheY-like chemotaxis protein